MQTEFAFHVDNDGGTDNQGCGDDGQCQPAGGTIDLLTELFEWQHFDLYMQPAPPCRA